MPADYDLVILGGTLAGRTVAAAAVGYGARVALVEPPGLFWQRQRVRYLLRGLRQLAEGRQRQAVSRWFHQDGRGEASEQFDWAALVKWSGLAASAQLSEYSVSALSRSGVDVILAMPERLSRKQVVVTVGHRRLRGRAALAAFGTVPCPISHLSSDRTLQCMPTGLEPLFTWDRLPKQITVWGESFQAVLWAEALSLMGVAVTLVADRVLPGEDSDVRRWVQAQCLSAGVKFVKSSDISAQVLSKAELYTLTENALVIDRQRPALALPEFVRRVSYAETGSLDDVEHTSHYLQTNAYLQTSHSRVFACGSLLHGEWVHDAVAQAEAQVAVWNALFWPKKRVDYGVIAQAYGRFVRVGQPPEFAIAGRAPEPSQGYRVWTASCANSANLSRISPQPSYCKIICQRKRIQSIHLLGDGAEALSPYLESVVGKPTHVLTSAIACPPLPPTAERLTDLLKDAAGKAEHTRWQPGNWRRDWAENWFNWRRS